MIREIKFRGISQKNNEFVYGDLIRLVIGGNIHFYIQPLDSKKIEVDYKTVGQFTGCLDYKRYAIYEGDIIQANDSNYTYKVVFEKGSFQLYHLKDEWGKWGFLSRVYDADMSDLVTDLKVIGNIHLKEKIQPQ